MTLNKPERPSDPPISPVDRSSDSQLDAQIAALLESAGAGPGTPDRDQLRSMLRTVVGLIGDRAADRVDRLDLKIAAAAIDEMRDSALTFGPHRHRRKVTIFGSARTQPTDPLYEQTRDFAAAIAERGWMVVTGAGPGIMAAGLEGAGIENALGASIRLPFEPGSNQLLDPSRLVDMKYFFTRKLALIRESDGFVVMPGGFGTLDETFELLTLLQTGKATPVPIVLLGLGKGYWRAWNQFVETVIEQGYVADTDRQLFTITNSIDEAVATITRFYANYHSVRWVGDSLVIRLQHAPSDADLAQLNTRFSALLVKGAIERTVALPPEVGENDHVELPRIRLAFDKRKPGRLRELIDALNDLVAAPTT